MANLRTSPTITIGTVNIDCHDSQVMADFYGTLLGWEIKWHDEDDDFIILGNPGAGPDLSFQPYEDYEPPVWPEQSGSLRKMLHFDMFVVDLPAATEHALACGARLADYQGRDDLRVMLDPAGHPFCLGTE